MSTESARSISITAGAAVTAYHFVTLASDGKFDHSGVQANADGIVLEDGVDGDRVPMAVPDSSVMEVVASAAISVGDDIGCAAAGEARTAVLNDVVMGKALSAAGAGGEIIEILFSKAGNLSL